MIRLDGGEFLMGSTDRLSYPDDGEGPLRRVRVDPFEVEPSAATNADFARVRGRDRSRDRRRAARLVVRVRGLLPDDFPPTRGVAAAPWWRQVEGADWRHPEGPHSDLEGRLDHPVVHV